MELIMQYIIIEQEGGLQTKLITLLVKIFVHGEFLTKMIIEQYQTSTVQEAGTGGVVAQNK